MNKHLCKILAFMLVFVMLFAIGCGKDNNKDSGSGSSTPPISGPDTQEPTEREDWTDLSVREATGANGVVASASAYASKAGLTVLENGGNAFDAAVATSFALGVVEPNASGIGGGGVMTAYNAKTGKYVFYNFREFLPAAGTPEKYRELGGDIALDEGVTAAGVPTQVAGLVKIVEDLGSGNVTLADILAPAIDYAENGFTIEPTLASAIGDAANKIVKDPQAKQIFSDGFEMYGAGHTLVQTNYANVLKEIAEKGADGFYKGWVAEAIVKAYADHGGIVTQADLDYAAANYPKIGEPLHGTYNGYDVYTATLPSSGGIILIETLNMLEHYCRQNNTTLAEFKAADPAAYAHVLATAMQLAYADKRHYMADNSISPVTNEPFVNVPIQGLMNKVYAAQRFDALYSPTKPVFLTSSYDWGGANRSSKGYAADQSPWDFQDPGACEEDGSDEGGEHYSTTSFSVTDKEGNIVTFTQTINHFWGAFVMPEGCGFYLNNQLSSFSLTETSVHYVQPYKQPVSHIMPTIIMKDGDPFATLGSPGSMRLVAAVIQTTLNLLDFGMGMQEAIAAPRIYSYCVSTADKFYKDGKKLLEVEYGEGCMSAETVAALEAIGYGVNKYSGRNLYFGGVQGIKFNYDEYGRLVSMTGGADPRRDGKALAW